MDRETREKLLQLAEKWGAEADAIRARIHAIPGWEAAEDGVAPEGWPTLPQYIAGLREQANQLDRCIGDLMHIEINAAAE